MEITFRGRTAVVTGGAMGIGGATASRLAAAGATVAILDINAEAAGKKCGELRAAGARAEAIACDVGNAAEVERAVAEVVGRLGEISVLVSNAGIQRYGDVLSTSEPLWDEVLTTNLKSCFLVSKAVLPSMLRGGGGAIVAVGSVQSIAALGNAAAYVTAKHGLLGLVRSMALDYARRGIRVNCVLPGAIDTPMLRWAAGLDPHPERVIEVCHRMHALGRMGTAEEVADAIVYLASDRASFITGAALLVDGGMMVPAGGMGFSESGTGSGVK